MCASTIFRILRGALAAGLFLLAGEAVLASGVTAAPVVYSLLGVWLGWQAITGAG